MTLIYDLTRTQPFGDIKIHGGGKYGEIVFKALIERSLDVIAYYNSSVWINPEILALCKEKSIVTVDSNEKKITELARERRAIIYSPIVDIELLKSEEQMPCISTVHGLRVLEMPVDVFKVYYKKYGWLEIFYKIYSFIKGKRDYKKALREHQKILGKKNAHTVTVSEHSKSSILAFIPTLTSENIPVFYSPSTAVHEEKADPYANEKYYLIVGANRWVKNALRALRALDEIFSERPDFSGRVIVTGVKDRSLFDRHLKNKNKFQFIDYVEDRILHSLYRGAFLFIYPSLNEGFGYPPLEAMAQGTPVIASAISSIPEICGDSVLYFNPMMISEIKMRVIQMEDESLRQSYADRGYKRFSQIKIKQDEDLGKLTEHLLSLSSQLTSDFYKANKR